MHTIALVNQKGGVGKSTTAVNLSAGLAQLGRRVLLMDLDPQAHATVALGLNPKQCGATVYSLLSGAAKINEVIRPISPGLSLIPSTINLAGGEAELTWQQNPHFILKRAMGELDESRFDFVVVDSPPQLGFLNVNSLAWVKHVFIPLTCEFYALHGLSLLVETVERIKAKLNPELAVTGVIANQYNPRRALTKDVLADLEQHFPGKVLKSKIRVNVRLAEAPSHGLSVHQYAPGSNGSKDYLNLAKEVLEILPAEASPEVVAAIAAIADAEAVAKGIKSEGPMPEVSPTWSAPAAEPEAAAAPADPLAEVAAELAAPAASPEPAPEAVAETPVVEEPTVEAPAEPIQEPAPVQEAAPEPAPEAAPEPAPAAEAPAEATPVAEASTEVAANWPAVEGRMEEPTLIVHDAAPAEVASEPVAEAAPEPAPVPASETVAEAATGVDPYAEGAAPSPKEFVSSYPATPVAALRESEPPAPALKEKTEPALPSVKAASMPYQQRLAMAGLKPIVTKKPSEQTPLPVTEKKGLFSRFWKK